jgi:uncharacterized repeat protein (TIGR01451 family)
MDYFSSRIFPSGLSRHLPKICSDRRCFRYLALLTLLLICLPGCSDLSFNGNRFVVNVPTDVNDVTPGDGVCDAGNGSCSLRAAIQESNAGSAATVDLIEFASGMTIEPSNELPELSQAVVIDGFERTSGNRSAPDVVLNGSDVLNGNGLTVGSNAGGTIIRGLVISGYFRADGAEPGEIANGIVVKNIQNVAILDCYIGTNANGTQAARNAGHAIVVRDTAASATAGMTIGGIDSQTSNSNGNLLSGNDLSGIFIESAPAVNGGTAITIQGNTIGLALDGTSALPNEGSGIFMGQVQGVLIGGNDIDNLHRNIISGNGGDGIEISGDTDGAVSQVQVINNFVGVGSDGSTARGNGRDGIRVTNASSVTIGGSTAAGGNVISANTEVGVNINDSNMIVQSNQIGTNAAGNAARPNNVGVSINGSGNTIGSPNVAGPIGVANLGNLISGNTSDGIRIISAQGSNIVIANYIGTDITGLSRVANGGDGIEINGSSNNIVGATSGRRNVISGNSQNGVRITGAASTGNTVRSNFIGIAQDGTAILGNSQNGILIEASADNNLVTAGNDEGNDVPNIISGNGGDGVEISDANTNGNTINKSFIGTDATGTSAAPNQNNGITVVSAIGNTIGGTNTNGFVGTGNLISGNRGLGIAVIGGSGLQILGNRIGTNGQGTGAIANAQSGIRVVLNNPEGNPINIGTGTAGTGNLISGNGSHGIEIGGPGAESPPVAGNANIRGNVIGLDATRTNRLANIDFGIYVHAIGSFANIGGTGANQRNYISGNNGDGISFYTEGPSSSTIQNNVVGLNSAGEPVGNGGDGIDLTNTSNVLIGGTTVGQGNTISGNNGDGVVLRPDPGPTAIVAPDKTGPEKALGDVGGGNRIQGNSIFNNSRLGINLVGGFEDANGVTENDADANNDADTGPNDLQNFPVITRAGDHGDGGIRIEGSLQSRPSTQYRIEFFASSALEVGGLVEGQRYLAGSTITITTDATGNRTFDTTANGFSFNGEYISATATEVDSGNTSEFSNPVQVATADVSISFTDSADPVAPESTFSYVVTISNSGPNRAPSPVVTVQLPPEVEFVSASGEGWKVSEREIGSNKITATYEDLDPREGGDNPPLPPVREANGGGNEPELVSSPSNPLTISVKAPAEAGELSATAQVSSNLVDPNNADNSQTITTTVTGSADLSVTYVATPTSVDVEGNYSYVARVSNNGPSTATNVVSSSVLPVGVTFVSATGTGWTSSFDATTRTVTATRPLLARGAAPDLVIAVRAPSSSGIINSTTSVASASQDPNPSDNGANASVTVNAVADVGVTITDSPDPVTILTDLEYTLTVTNAGPSTATNVVLTNTLPSNVVFLSANPAVSTRAGVVLTFNLGTLASGASRTVTIRVQPQTVGSLTNFARVTRTEIDRNETNNSASETTVVNNVVPSPTAAPQVDLDVTMNASASSVAVQKPLTYQITVINRGPATATNVVLSNVLPAQSTLIAASPQPVDINARPLRFVLGTLASGQSVQISVTITASEAGSIRNEAVVSATENDSNPANNSAAVVTVVTAEANLSLELSDAPDPVTVGQEIVYSLLVTNNGPSPATGVQLSNTLPAGVTFLAATPVPTVNGRQLNFNLNGLAVGATQRITIRVRANTPGVQINTAAVQATEVDPVPADNAAETSTAVRSIAPTRTADVRVGVEAPAFVNQGSLINYSIQVDNEGPDAAPLTVLTVQLPPQSTLMSSTPGASSRTGNTLTFNLGTLNNQSSRPVTVRVRPDVVGNMTLRASITNGERDPDTTNNAAQATTRVDAVADLAVNLIDTPDPATVNGNVTYVATVINRGPSTARNVQLRVNLPSQSTFVSSTPAALRSGNVLTLNLGTLASRAMVRVLVVFRASAAGTLSGSAVVSGREADLVSANNTATTVTTVRASADVSLRMTVSPAAVYVGQNLNFVLAVANNGPSSSIATVQQTLPTGVTFVSASDGGTRAGSVVTWNLGTLAAGASRRLSVVVRSTRAGSLSSSAQVFGSVFDATPANNTATATATASLEVTDLAIENVDLVDPVPSGGQTTYRLTVRNIGRDAARNVTVSNVWPAGVQFVSALKPVGTVQNRPNRVNFNLGTINRGAVVVLEVVVRVTLTGGSIQNTATVSSSTADANSANNRAVQTTVVAAPELKLSQGALQTTGSLQAGGSYLPGLFGNGGIPVFEQTITLRNNGTVALPGPISLLLGNLSDEVVLDNRSGVTRITMPGTPYVNFNLGSDDVLSPGEQVSVKLRLASKLQEITYTPRILTAGAPR